MLVDRLHTHQVASCHSGYPHDSAFSFLPVTNSEVAASQVTVKVKSLRLVTGKFSRHPSGFFLCQVSGAALLLGGELNPTILLVIYGVSIEVLPGTEVYKAVRAAYEPDHQKITRVLICRLTQHYMSYKALYDMRYIQRRLWHLGWFICLSACVYVVNGITTSCLAK